MGDAALSFGTKKPSSPSRHVFPKKFGLGSWTITVKCNVFSIFTLFQKIENFNQSLRCCFPLQKTPCVNITVWSYQMCLSYTFAGIHQHNINMKPFMLRGGRRHRIMLQGDLLGSALGYVYVDFLVNLPPYGGNCSIDKKEGKQVQFLIH